MDDPRSELDKALEILRTAVLDGLRHGYFDYRVCGETVKGGKRQLRIIVGKSYQFIVAEHDLEK
jgi:hypothetical protein